MSDKAAATKKKLAQNADKITIGVLAIILVVMGYFYLQEQNSNLAAANAEGRPATFQDTLADNPAMSMLQTMSENPSITQNPNAARLIQFNMFDNSTVAAEQAAEAQATSELATARQMIDNGQVDEARERLQQIVPVIRYNRQAVELLDSISTPSETAEMDPGMMGDPNATPMM